MKSINTYYSDKILEIRAFIDVEQMYRIGVRAVLRKA
jgi:hypothetical protein